MSRRRVPFNDADYLAKLSPSERDWYKQFIAEHYFGRQPKNRNSRILPQDLQREAWREQHRERRDAQWRAATQADFSEITYDPSNALIELLEKLPLSSRGVMPWGAFFASVRFARFLRGIRMETSKEDTKDNTPGPKPLGKPSLAELDYFGVMLQVAIDSVNARIIEVEKADTCLKCVTFLKGIKADVDSQRRTIA